MARYSTDQQKPTSVEAQIALCRKEAEEKGWVIVDVRSDHGFSGTFADRPGFLALEDGIRDRRADLVLFESLDWLSRDSEHTARFYKPATQTELYALDSGFLDPIRIGFSVTMAAAFLENLAFKTRCGLGGRIAAGKSAGSLSYGYAAGDETGQGRQAEDLRPLEAEHPQRQRRARRRHPEQRVVYQAAGLGTPALLNDRSMWKTMDVPDLHVIDEDTWVAAKARPSKMRALRGKPEPGTSTLATTRGNRRGKYLLSDLIRCGLCDGPMTIAGGNPKAGKRRYYCANAREKGAAICEGMPGVLQSDIEELALSGIRDGMMQDDAYERFRRDFEAHLRKMRPGAEEDLKLRDKMIAEQQAKVDFIFEAIETGEHSPPLVARLNKLQAELDQMKSQREAATPAPVELPEDLPALYRAHVEDLVGMLSDPTVRDRASDALRELISALGVHPQPGGGHRVELEGKMLGLLGFADNKNAAALSGAACSFELVAGVGFEPTTFRL